MSANRFIALIEAGRVRDAAGLKRAFRGLAKRAHPDAAGAFRATEGGASGGAPGDAATGTAPTRGGPAGPEAAHRAFIALRAEYEEALARLSAPRGPGEEPGAAAPAKASPSSAAAASAAEAAQATTSAVRPAAHPWDRRAFYASFEDLRARGLPRRPPTPGPAAAYDRSRAELLAYLAGRDLLRPAGRLREAYLGLERAWTLLAKDSSRGGSAAESRALAACLDNAFCYHRFAFAHVLAIAKSYGAEALEALERKGNQEARRFLAFILDDLSEGPALED